VAQVRRAIDSPTCYVKDIFYAYNLDGSLKSLTYPSGRVVNYTYNSAGQPLTATDGNTTQYVGNATYYPSGAEYQQFMPNIYFRTDVNQRLQINGYYSDNMLVTSYYMAKSYGYNDGHNNGNVMSATNNKDANRTQTFTYDPLNRITAGWSQAGSGALSWGENYSIDAWGNLQMAPMAGKAHGGSFQIASDGSNHATGLPYDAAGNLTAYNSSAYTYDAGNMMKTVGSTTYWYDADGQRFQKWQSGTGSKTYWYGVGGETLGEGDAAGNLTAEYVYFGGKRTARIDLPANTVHYYLSDHLTSTSEVVSSSGVIEEESDYSPFGTEVVVTGPGVNHYKFTGKERDLESGLDYFGARYYSNALGRWLTPDWSAKPAAVPYAVLGDPQSLNLYSYVGNIPTTGIDPDGHCGNSFCQIAAGVAIGTVNFIWNSSPGGQAIKWNAAIHSGHEASRGGCGKKGCAG
jgi:RHS repeat-associated protein